MNRLTQILEKHEGEILRDWTRELNANATRLGKQNEGHTAEQCSQLLTLLRQATSNGNIAMNTESWRQVRDFLTDISRTRAQMGFTPAETATFVFSLKKPLFAQVRNGTDAEAVANDVWAITEIVDALGLWTADAYQKGREEVIQRQQQELMELSTPVVKLWDGVLALPLIGTLDSARTQVVMESLLQKIVETGAETAIIDITGVPTVDTLVAQHLIKTVTAARLMGADCIISGVRPQIAQTIVHLGVNLSDIVTKATLADAFQLALRQSGKQVITAQLQKG